MCLAEKKSPFGDYCLWPNNNLPLGECSCGNDEIYFAHDDFGGPDRT